MAFQIENGVLEKFIEEPGVTEVVIPEDVTIIGLSAFDGCESLISVTFPDNVMRIDDYSFSYCENLTSITGLNSMTKIGCEAFKGCSSLANEKRICYYKIL